MVSQKRPNIIFIHTDSMDGRAMGCMGHPALSRSTPNLDCLAREGVLFRNAYSNNPICCPSRSSMWSGLYTHHCEGWNNHKGLSESDPTFLNHLVRTGYSSKILGKTDYLSGYHTERAKVSAWTRSANIMSPNYRIGPPCVLDDYRPRVSQGDWHNIDEAAAWLRRKKTSDAPFFLYLGIHAPHPPFVTSRYYLDMIDESRVVLPPLDENKHPVLAYQRCNKNWLHGFSDENIRLVRRIYFAMIAEVDAMLGELLKTVRETGQAGSTHVIFSSDHGELALEHRQFFKMSPYEPSVRVPLIIRGPGIRPNVTAETLVALVDIYPTLMDMAQLPHPGGLDGHSLMPELMGRPTEHPGWVLAECHDSSCRTGIFMLRQENWKYIAYVGCEPQLFNLADDPWEINNLAEKNPAKTRALDVLLRQIVDYEAVDRKVKAYDQASFRQWREEHKTAGDYNELMARIFSGWDGLAAGEGKPWTAADERQIESWLG
ncbi:MAG: sulfatase-like hydrolase/transferase [Kiritimatiellia bacterium]|nr:sulfatase-like hydrolase/transferase [Kiritimatiellia bacterium]